MHLPRVSQCQCIQCVCVCVLEQSVRTRDINPTRASIHTVSLRSTHTLTYMFQDELTAFFIFHTPFLKYLFLQLKKRAAPLVSAHSEE